MQAAMALPISSLGVLFDINLGLILSMITTAWYQARSRTGDSTETTGAVAYGAMPQRSDRAPMAEQATFASVV